MRSPGSTLLKTAKTNMSSPSAHAKLSPSAAVRWVSCTASVALAAQLPPTGDTSYAEEGTAAHALAETILGGSPKNEWIDRWGDTYDWDAMSDSLQSYIEYVSEKANAEDALSLYLEERMSTGIPGCWGTSDVVIVGDGYIHIIDLKYGQGVPVSAVGNYQMRLYAVAALNSFSDIIRADEVRTTIHQPRLGNVSEYTYSAGELRSWIEHVVWPAVREIETGAGVFRPSDKACRWCPASGQCRAQRDAVVSDSFGDPHLLSPEEVAEELDRAEQMRAWLKALDSVARNKADQGQLPGWKMVAGRGRRVVTDPETALERLIDAGFRPSDVRRVELKGITDLEKIVGKKDLPLILGDTLTKKPGNPSLVRESDKRAAISSVNEMFENLEN